MLVLALESSTSSAKALLYDPEKGVVRTGSCHYPPEFCKDGVTGTDEVYRLTMEMGRRVAAGEDVAAIALSCVWHSVAICDSGMRPLGNTYSWNFMKPSGMSERARQDTALADRLYRSTGCMPHVTYPRESLRYLRANGLDLRDTMLPSQGGFVDIRPEHTALEMYRALQMGILFNIYQCYEVLTQNVGVPQEIYVSGGILNSRRWTQMAADIFGTRMLCVKNLNASCAGAAVLAMHAAGVMDDVRAYTRDIEDARVVAPRAEYTERYRKLYERYLWYYDRTSHS